MTESLCLKSYQEEHFERVIEILKRFYFYVDGSEMGTGKTYIAAAAALALELPCIVICPLSARNIWETVFSSYGVKVYNLPETGGIITYDALRSRKGYQPKHGLLTRGSNSDGSQFYSTELLSLIIQQGVLIIFDECQKLKNTSDQYRAARTILRQIYALGGKSRVALLSGTPLDKEEQVINFLRMVGFVTSRNLYSKVQGKIRLEGVNDLHEWGRRVNEEATQKFISKNRFKSTQKGAMEYVFRFFTEVIKPGIMSIMPRPEMEASKDIKNGYFKLSKEEEIEYRKTIRELGQSVHWVEGTEEINRTKDSMGAVTNALVKLQKIKTGPMIRVAKEILNNNQTTKVILFADYYKEILDRMLEELKEFKPLEVTGRLNEDQRNANIVLFQKANSDHRLLIGNPLVGGLAVNLHDTTGMYPRVMLIMPNYRINELHQATGRIFRTGTIGVAKIRFFYGQSGLREKSILDALSRKGKVMKTILKEQVEDGVKFPDEYEDEFEN